jgi:hypothetical protein
MAANKAMHAGTYGTLVRRAARCISASQLTASCRRLRRMGQRDDSEIVGRRVSVTLDAALHEFVERVASALHLSKSAAVRSMIAELALAESPVSASAQVPSGTEV